MGSNYLCNVYNQIDTAFREFRVSVVSCSCQLTQSPNVLVSISQDGLTALILAVKEGCTETVKVLLHARADVNIREKVNKPNYM